MCASRQPRSPAKARGFARGSEEPCSADYGPTSPKHAKRLVLLRSNLYTALYAADEVRLCYTASI